MDYHSAIYRQSDETDDIVRPFVNPLGLYVHLSFSWSFRESRHDQVYCRVFVEPQFGPELATRIQRNQFNATEESQEAEKGEKLS